MLASELPVHCRLLDRKWDVRVLGRLRTLLRNRRVDAVITVGAGDKMFWGRSAAKLEGVPVICSALHSTGWPDEVGRMNRWLTPITDAFIACATSSRPVPRRAGAVSGTEGARHPERSRHRTIPTARGLPSDALCGIRFRPRHRWSPSWRRCGPEKNHELFLNAAAQVRRLPNRTSSSSATGPCARSSKPKRPPCSSPRTRRFLGNRSEIENILAAADLFTLTSHNEANPVSILEALACGLPVVAPRVGSIPESVREGETGMLVQAGDCDATAEAWLQLLTNATQRLRFGASGRDLVVRHFSLERMVGGYEDLLLEIYQSKCGGREPCREPSTPVSDPSVI